MQTIGLYLCYIVLILLFSTAYNTSLIYCFVIWCLHTNKRRICSSTLSGHPSSSFGKWSKTLIPWYLLRFVAVHCGVHCSVHCDALYVHCAKHAVCAVLLLEAWGHILCLWVAAVKMKVRLGWGFGMCKREFVQACVCTAINQKK